MCMPVNSQNISKSTIAKSAIFTEVKTDLSPIESFFGSLYSIGAGSDVKKTRVTGPKLDQSTSVVGKKVVCSRVLHQLLRVAPDLQRAARFMKTFEAQKKEVCSQSTNKILATILDSNLTLRRCILAGPGVDATHWRLARLQARKVTQATPN